MPLLFLFIEPVRGDPVFVLVVHLFGADLDLHALAVGADHGGVQAAIGVRFRHGDVVLDAPRERRPRFVDHAERGITFGHGGDDDAHGDEVMHALDVHIALQ